MSDGRQRDERTRSPEELERDIARTREILGDTVEALSEKVDVKARATAAIDEQKRRLQVKGGELRRKWSAAGGEREGADAVADRVVLLDELTARTRARPLAYLAAALGVGVAVGMILRR